MKAELVIYRFIALEEYTGAIEANSVWYETKEMLIKHEGNLEEKGWKVEEDVLILGKF